MPTFYADNPLTMVYSELWKIIEARSELDQLVVQGNRIRYDDRDNRDPHKDNISTQDVPEILLASEGITGNLKSSSNGTSLQFAYGVRTTTGDLRYTDFLAQVQWMLLGSLVDIRQTLGVLTWQGKKFIESVNLESTTIGFSDLDIIQGGDRKRGWADLMRFIVSMRFNTADISLELINQL